MSAGASASASPPVVIAGAGIGGLTLAAALARRGLPVVVLERAAKIDGGAGAGITVQTNAMVALARLGLGLPEAIAAEGAALEVAAILDARGRPLGPPAPVGTLARQLGQPAVAIHRARLHRVLLDAVVRAAGAGAVRTGAAVTGWEGDGDGAALAVQLADGTSLPACFLVGADGLRSLVRARLLGDGEPIYRGYTSWRGVVPAGALPVPARATESWGRGARFGLVPLGHGEIYWFAVADAPAGGRDTDVHAALLERFGAWHAPIREAIAATPAERIVRTDISDRKPTTKWHAGRVVLLGDAAHPMTPNYGQGGCQAIEDAVVLDACLAAAGDDPAQAFPVYTARRVARANRIVVGARRFGAVAQWSNPVAVALRDTVMRMTPERALVKQMQKVLSFNG